MRAVLALLLAGSLARAQSFSEESARNDEWSRARNEAVKAAETADEDAKEVRTRREARAAALVALKQQYDADEGPARDVVVEQMKLLEDVRREVERRIPRMQARARRAEEDLARARALTDGWESELDAVIANNPGPNWDALRNARAAIVTSWIDAASRRARLLREAVADLVQLEKTLVITRTTHQLNNLTMRSPDEITWGTAKRAAADLPRIVPWLGDAVVAMRDYFASEGARGAAVRWLLSAFGAILLALFAAVLLRKYAARPDATEGAAAQRQALRVAARFVRRAIHLGVLYFLPVSAASILPDLPAAVAVFLERMAVFLAGAYLFWAVYRELLRPGKPERALLQVDDPARRRIAFSVHALIGTALIVRPLEIGVRAFGYANPAGAALLEGVFLVVVAAVLSGVLFRKRVFEELLPKADATWARVVRAVARMLRPFLMLLMPTVVVLHLARLEVLAAAVTQTSVALLGSIIATALLYQVAKAIAYGWLHRVHAEEVERPDSRGGATLGAVLFVLRFGFFFFAVWMFAELAGTTIDNIRLTIDVPLPFQTGDDAPTYWGVFAALAILFFFLFGTRHAKDLLQYQVLERTALDRSTQYTIATLSGYVVLSIGIVASVRQVFNLSDLGTIVAALSVGIGFGLQELVSNFISGLVLLFERPIRVGDTIEVGPNRGLIRQINIRATTVQTKDNIFILVPNRDLMTQTVVNYGYDDPKIRLRVPVGVSYGSDPEQVKEVLLAVAEECDKVLRHPIPQVQFVQFADSSLNFLLLVWIQRPEQAPAITSTVNFMIFKALKDAGIEIPFPQRDIHIKSRPPGLEPGEDRAD